MTATSTYLNEIPRAESEIRARAFLSLPGTSGPELTGSPLLDHELRALFDDCNLRGRSPAAIHALKNWLGTARWRDKQRAWPTAWAVTPQQAARAIKIVTGWLETAKETT